MLTAVKSQNQNIFRPSLSYKYISVCLFEPFYRAKWFSYPSIYFTSEISTLSYISSLKKVPLSGGASPFGPLYGVPRAPKALDVGRFTLWTRMTRPNLHIVDVIHHCLKCLIALLSLTWSLFIEANRSNNDETFVEFSPHGLACRGDQHQLCNNC